ncbi:zf-HC2 domain-containing protein [bacterium]|nr:zf-HC2 domain-containing protein [bacterium]
MGSSLCPDSEVVSLVLDGEAEPGEKAGYETHLKECSNCRQQHEFYSQLRGLVRTSCSQENCPDLLKARMLKALASEVQAPKKSSRPSWGLGWLAAASAAIFSFVALRPAADKATPLALSLSQDHSRCCAVPASDRPAQSPANLAQATFGAAMPEMAQVQQLQPYDVRLCPVLQGERVIHVLCRDRQQRVFSMYTMPSDRVNDLPSSGTQPRVYDTQDNRVAAWQHKGWLFSLVSRVPEEELLTMVGGCQYECPQQQRLVNQPLPFVPASNPR